MNTLTNKTNNIMLSFILGGLIDKVDDYIDSVEPLTQNDIYIKYFLELIIIVIVIYFIYFNKETYIVYTYTCVLLGFASYVFAHNTIDSYLWYILIAIALPKFIITSNSTFEKIKSLSEHDL